MSLFERADEDRYATGPWVVRANVCLYKTRFPREGSLLAQGRHERGPHGRPHRRQPGQEAHGQDQDEHAPERRPGDRGVPPDQVRQHGDHAAARTPTASPATSSRAFSSITSRASVRRRKPAARSRASSPRRFQHVAQLHGRQPEGAQQQPQPAEALERGEVGVLHGQEAGQPLGRSFRRASP